MKRDRSLRPLLTISAISFGFFLITLAPVRHVKVSGGTTNRQMLQERHPLHADSSTELRAQKVKQIIASPVLSEFDVWVRRHLDKKLPANNSQLKRGENLAVKRRELFKELIRLAPAEALKRAIAEEDYKRLPPSISKNIEKRVSAYGDLIVYMEMRHQRKRPESMSGSRIDREVVINKVRYRAFVYGRREAMTTKYNIPLQGIFLDDYMAVDESPVRRLKPSEYASRAVEWAKVKQHTVVAEVGGKLEYFSDQAAVEKFVREQVEWETKIGPVRPQSGKPFSPWTEGKKKVLFIRLEFPDRTGEPLTAVQAQDLMDSEVNPFFQNNSYNKTSLETTVIPVVVRMPQNQSFYVSFSSGVLFADAENAARAAGFEPDNFELDIFAMSWLSGFEYYGISTVGGRGAALNGHFDLATTAHELGHNYGLFHAESWFNTDNTVIGSGTAVEYGNTFDVMGGGEDRRAHFNGHYKRRLEWLSDANIQTITSDGFYRIFAHDSPEPGRIRSLKIQKNSTKNYWVEFRQLFTDNSNAMNGALILWDYQSDNFRQTQLLDLTPGTPNLSDAPLIVGQCLHDPDSGIRVTVCGKGGTTPESLDIRVELNAGCTFILGHTFQSVSASGGKGEVPVNIRRGKSTAPLDTQSGCHALATSNAEWISALSIDASPARYIVAANYDSRPRTGTITIAGQAFTVEQAGSTTPCAPLPPGLVAWWRGDGNALDQTGRNHGTLIGNTLFAGGKIGGGFSSDASASAGFVEVPDSPSLALTRSMTLEGWAHLSSHGHVIIERRSEFVTQASYALSTGGFDGYLSFSIVDSDRQGFILSSPDEVPLNDFVHFAATLDDVTNQVQLYINGNPVVTSPTPRRPFDFDPLSTPKIRIGRINGITDELSVYDRALAPSEIQAIYNAGTAASGSAGKCLPPSGSGAGTVQPTVVQLDSATYTVNESGGAATLTVTRSGDTRFFTTVEYATTDGSASARSDYLPAFGKLRFEGGETSKTITVLVVNDVLSEDPENFNLRLNNPAFGTLGSRAAATVTISSDETLDGPSPVNEASFDTHFFVRQHYLDFFNREADVSGLALRKNEIEECTTQTCREARKVSVSATFLSTEFQQAGYLVERLYKTAYGDATGTSTYGGLHQLSVPKVSQSEYLRDTQKIGKDVVVGQCVAEAILELNKNTLIEEFVKRPSFRTDFPDSMTEAGFVDKLNMNTGGVLSEVERNRLVSDLTAEVKTRAQVLRAVAEDPDLFAAEANRAFVLAHFFGYLRRNPNDGPGGDYTDYDFWLTHVNGLNGNFIAPEMVEAFITSEEYQRRFGLYATTFVPVIPLRAGPRVAFEINSGIRGREQLVIRDREAWRDVWSRIYALRSPAPPLPEIDFAKEMLIVVAMGTRPTGGYGIRINSAKARDNNWLEIGMTSFSPGRNCVTEQAATAPVDIVRIRKTIRRIDFVGDEDAHECLPTQ